MTCHPATLSCRCALLLSALLLSACDRYDGAGLLPPPADDTLPSLALTELDLAFTFTQPVDIAHAGDGSGRLFVVERAGVVWSVAANEVSTPAFLDISGRVQSTGGSERGLLGIAFPPGFDDDGHFYVHYTSQPGFAFGIDIAAGDTIVSRIHIDGGIADPDREELVLHVPQPSNNHNGGQIAFGPDGYLYIALGDGGGSGDPDGNGQDPGTLLGALLRIDVEAGIAPYRIPDDNPFTGDAGARDEIWAYGLRNPWRFSFDRQTGDLYIADVGQDRYEEINFQPAASGGGENYGWNIMEGLHCFSPPDGCDQTSLTLPVADYPISGTADCAVTGGHVYRGGEHPDLQGVYLYGDFCSGRIRGFRVDPAGDVEPGLLLDSGLRISTFGEDEAGNLYVADYLGGDLYRIGLE
jgi:glucose/arabinose dehydrogenase